MLGHVAATLLNTILSWGVVLMTVYMAFTAYKKRKSGESWEPQEARFRNYIWIALFAGWFIFMN